MRYSSDPHFRLYYINASRAQRGLPPLASHSKGRSEAARETVSRRQRDSRGRFA
jgi:hypothetical protein